MTRLFLFSLTLFLIPNLYAERGEALAIGEQITAISELDEVQTQSDPLIIGIIVGAATVVPYGIWRIIQAKNRAEAKAEEFFPGENGYGQKGDAFKHIFVSVLLRKSLTRTGSWAVMGAVELFGKNLPRDHQMDYHNNKVGRIKRYRSFKVKKKSGDIKKWEEISVKIRDFINDPQNGVKMDWAKNPPTSNRNGRKRLKKVPKSKYVWYED